MYLRRLVNLGLTIWRGKGVKSFVVRGIEDLLATGVTVKVFFD